MSQRVFLFGVPLAVGGANSESASACLLWRLAGIDVTILRLRRCLCRQTPANFAAFGPHLSYAAKLLAAGCQVVESEPGRLDEVPGLPGGIVVAFCNQHALHVLPELHALGCRLVYSPCMCYVSQQEQRVFADHPPAALHFQSRFQLSQTAGQYRRLGIPRGRQWRIRGALDLAEFPFAPTLRSGPMGHRGPAFRVGRLARPARTKWSRSLWPVLKAVREGAGGSGFGVRGGKPAASPPQVPSPEPRAPNPCLINVRARCMAWSPDIESKCGRAPKWARCYPAGALSAQDFLAGCHALLCMNGGDVENWPRVVLEAMAAGVPVVAQRQWGYREQIDDGRTGLLYDDDRQAAEQLARLAGDEAFRLRIAVDARRAVERLTDPATLGRQWCKLFASLEDRSHTRRRAA